MSPSISRPRRFRYPVPAATRTLPPPRSFAIYHLLDPVQFHSSIFCPRNWVLMTPCVLAGNDLMLFTLYTLLYTSTSLNPLLVPTVWALNSVVNSHHIGRFGSCPSSVPRTAHNHTPQPVSSKIHCIIETSQLSAFHDLMPVFPPPQQVLDIRAKCATLGAHHRPRPRHDCRVKQRCQKMPKPNTIVRTDQSV